MRVERMRLTDFRNYTFLDLTLPAGLVVFTGRNAQGKSNILEAVTLLATSKSFRTTSERELVRWGAAGHFTRVEATIARRRDQAQVEVVVTDTSQPTEATQSLPAPPATLPRKHIKVNGTPRRAMDLVGQITIVIFSPTDLDLVVGSPSERRRFLDMTLCQVHPSYCRTLSQYQKVLLQRSALLRRIREGQDSPQALTFWDEQLATLAVPIMRERATFLERATSAAAHVYAALAHDDKNEDDEADDDIDDGTFNKRITSTTAKEGPSSLQLVYQPSYDGALGGSSAEVIAAMRARLAELRRREIAQGANVLGPHRDDLAFLAGGVDISVYGSRGQQRSVALALKLAELDYIEQETGDQPILLLDDVLSELDMQHRADLLAAVRPLEQVLLTTTDAASLPPDALAYAHRYRVRGGRVIEQRASSKE